MVFTYTRDQIATGDLLVWAGGNGTKSKSEIYLDLVRLFTRSDYGHISIAHRRPDGTLWHVEATQPCIREVPVLDAMRFLSIPVPLYVTEEQYQDFFQKKIGLPYSFMDAVRAYLGMTLDAEDGWQCVELSNYFYRSLGINLGDTFVPNRFVKAMMNQLQAPLLSHVPRVSMI